eukprot:scaffold16.g137.t1
MNDTEVTKTILQMTAFIKQEAEEKAAEIAVQAEEEFQITKTQMVEQEKQRVKNEYARREGSIEVKKKVEYSKQLNESRLKVLQAREEAVQSVLREAHDKLAALSKDKGAYQKLLVDLLAQAMYKLSEPKGLVRCRKVDEQLVRDALAPAKAKYTQEFGGEAPALELDTAHWLPPPPTNGNHNADEFQSRRAAAEGTGGVVLTSADGRIVCSNTLDDRLRITYAQNLHIIRGLLFS